MTDNKMPELTLSPDDTAAAAAEVPTLTLTPEAPEVPQEEEKKVEPVNMDENLLTEEEKKAVEDFSHKIDIRDTNQVLQYGAAAQKSVAAFSENALNNVRTKDMGQIGDDLSQLVVELKGFGEDEDRKGLRGLFKKAGNKVVLGAADTFRAAAIEQLQIWGERVDVPVVKQQMGSDPASVAFDTVSSAKASGADVVIIDTAGRLHNKVGLMKELSKIKNVMQKVVPDAPHEVLLVLDGSTGQNAFEQAKQFVAATEVNELAITKLDGTAKGGVVIGISDQFKIPVKYIGLGEGLEDLQIFRKKEFVDSLFS